MTTVSKTHITGPDLRINSKAIVGSNVGAVVYTLVPKEYVDRVRYLWEQVLAHGSIGSE